MRSVIFGVDNGVSGSIAIIDNIHNKIFYYKTPIISQQDYTKKQKNVTRLDGSKLKQIFEEHCSEINNISSDCIVILERPLVNPSMFNATLSAIRGLEATLIVLEILKIPYRFIDSKEWQKALLPQGIKDRKILKDASRDIGIRYFPEYSEIIKSSGDADSFLIAEYARQKNF